MIPELSHELRQAIDEKNGKPVYIVDSERHETYVLLTSADFDRVRPMLGYQSNNGAWSDDKNARRLGLIDKKIARTITPAGTLELADLQQRAENHFDKIAPPPMKGVAELHQRLSERDRQ